MKFKGDIIITDPCYIIREDVDYRDLSTKPKWEDFHGIKPYPRGMKGKQLEDFFEKSRSMQTAYEEWQEKNPDDWSLCGYGEDMEKLGIKHFITHNTLYGDWSCTTFKIKDASILKESSDISKEDIEDENLGQFCADAGMVGVFLLEEVLKYNPKFDYHITKPHTTTLIKNFDGEVSFDIVSRDNDTELLVRGRGNINFITRQTGY